MSGIKRGIDIHVGQDCLSKIHIVIQLYEHKNQVKIMKWSWSEDLIFLKLIIGLKSTKLRPKTI
jgi:hypothetical protein